MNRQSLRIASAACCLLLLPSLLAAQPQGGGFVGLLSKVIPNVQRKEAGKDWNQADRGQILGSGDVVRTGTGALAIIKFKDNSLVRLRESSELTVSGKTSGSSFSKSVDIRTGVVGFNVQKQRAGEEFRFTSPTSVASIKGTAGVLNAAPLADTLTITEGAVLFTNKISLQSIDVLAGFTGLSGKDGSLQSRPSTQQERNAAREALRDDQRKRLEIELRDPKGKTNRLKIEFID